MNLRQTIVHELFILFWLSLVQFAILLVIGLFHLEDTLFWPSLILTLLATIIQDQDAWPETPSIGQQVARVITNVTACCIVAFVPTLICQIDSDTIGLYLEQGEAFHYECNYGAGGMALLLVSMSAFLAGFARFVITGIHLIVTLSRSIWLHFNDDID